MADEVTGRDAYIMAQALILAINAIDSTEVNRRQFSNREDMMKLLIAIWPSPDGWATIAHGVGVDPPSIDSPDYEEFLNAGGPTLRLVWERPEPPEPSSE